MKKIFTIFSKFNLLIDNLYIIINNADQVKTNIITDQQKMINAQRLEIKNLKTRIGIYRLGFFNGEDLRQSFINEFPKNWAQQ